MRKYDTLILMSGPAACATEGSENVVNPYLVRCCVSLDQSPLTSLVTMVKLNGFILMIRSERAAERSRYGDLEEFLLTFFVTS
jgi:hypothetical protein